MSQYDYSKDLNRIRNMLNGRGFLGWIIRKFFGKKQTDVFTRQFDLADNQLQSTIKQQDLAKRGMPARAVVLNIEDTTMLINNRPVAILTLRVQPENAPEYEVKIQAIVSRFTFPRPNDVIDVKYNPLNPKEVALVN